jgi:Holliday junction resolvase-like predicted endonuclease
MNIGKCGEIMAFLYLILKGHRIIHRNWRKGRYEIDLISIKNKILYFHEVKSGMYKSILTLSERVDFRKKRNLNIAISLYNKNNKDYKIYLIYVRIGIFMKFIPYPQKIEIYQD